VDAGDRYGRDVGLGRFLRAGALANFASRSKRERLWGPVSLAIAVCCGLIATSIQG
jgi:hypothetical protein